MKIKGTFIWTAVFCLTIGNASAQSVQPTLAVGPSGPEKTNCRAEVTQAAIEMEQARDQVLYQQLLRDQAQELRGAIVSYAIQIHIVRMNDGTGGIPVADVRNEIANWVNPYFAGVDIAFVECNPEQYINSTTYYTLGDGSEDPDVAGDAMAAANNVANVVNVYFVDDPDGACGWARFPWDLPADYVVIANGCATNKSTLVHELGHYFSLYHTHETAFGSENVTRIGSNSCYNCLTAGDKLCDTPADPTLNAAGVSITAAPACVYSSSLMDACSTPVAYTPDPTLIMSYSLKACRTLFSTEEKAKMNLTKASAPGSPLFGRNYLQQGCPCERANAVCNNITVNLNSGGTASITAGQVDNGSTADCGLASMSVTPSSFNCSNVGGNSVTLTVTDVLGWVSTCTSTVTIVGATSPMITGAASNVTVECNGSGNATAFANWLGNKGGATATDACGGSWSNNSTGLSNGCGATGAELVTFTFTDPTGNSASTSATFRIVDTAPPVLTCPANIHLPECVATATWAALASDVCGGVTVVSSPPSGSVFPKGTTTVVTVTATDDCGLQTSCTFNVTRDPDLQVSVAPIATSALNTCAAGTGANIVLGYGGGPKCVVLTATGSGGHGPYTYAWTAPAGVPASKFTNANTATPKFCADFQTSPCVTYTFVVTVTDIHGCTETADINVVVVNVTCGNNPPMVSVCHRPPGSPADQITLCIAPYAVPWHFSQHPDCLGGCNTTCVSLSARSLMEGAGSAATDTGSEPYSIAVMPNPFNTNTVLVVTSNTDTDGQLSILDLSGREVANLYKGQLRKDAPVRIEFDASGLRAGSYIARLVDSDGRVKHVTMVLVR